MNRYALKYLKQKLEDCRNEIFAAITDAAVYKNESLKEFGNDPAQIITEKVLTSNGLSFTFIDKNYHVLCTIQEQNEKAIFVATISKEQDKTEAVIEDLNFTIRRKNYDLFPVSFDSSGTDSETIDYKTFALEWLRKLVTYATAEKQHSL